MIRTIGTLALAGTLVLPNLAAADEPFQRRMVVTGEGEAAAAPDIALLSLTVMREASTANEALEANSSAMQDVIAAVKAFGIEDRDIQTAGIQINPRYAYSTGSDGAQQGKLVGYQVLNTLSLRIRDVGKTGEILDKAVSLGVNQGGNVQFTNEDPSDTLDEARRKAVADAISKARVLSEAAGIKLGRVIEISDSMPFQPPIPMVAKSFAAERAVPIEAGENSYRVQLSVTFEIE
jgi:uncharacterized protein YggE